MREVHRVKYLTRERTDLVLEVYINPCLMRVLKPLIWTTLRCFNSPRFERVIYFSGHCSSKLDVDEYRIPMAQPGTHHTILYSPGCDAIWLLHSVVCLRDLCKTLHCMLPYSTFVYSSVWLCVHLSTWCDPWFKQTMWPGHPLYFTEMYVSS